MVTDYDTDYDTEYGTDGTRYHPLPEFLESGCQSCVKSEHPSLQHNFAFSFAPPAGDYLEHVIPDAAKPGERPYDAPRPAVQQTDA